MYASLKRKWPESRKRMWQLTKFYSSPLNRLHIRFKLLFQCYCSLCCNRNHQEKPEQKCNRACEPKQFFGGTNKQLKRWRSTSCPPVSQDVLISVLQHFHRHSPSPHLHLDFKRWRGSSPVLATFWVRSASIDIWTMAWTDWTGSTPLSFSFPPLPSSASSSFSETPSR